MESSQEEIIYGSDSAETTHEGSTGGQDVMSEKVEHLARDIYAEFERMMEKYDAEVVKNLMPLVVNVLESLDLAGIENQEHQVELELVKEDNEQLVTQYEREKCLRKNAEQRLLELEYSLEEERNDLISKIESLESILRMLEMKSKNAVDHSARLEEKEAEMKKEYAKLHDRYTDLFKTHFDYMEKTKILFGAQQIKQATTPLENASFDGINCGSLNEDFELDLGLHNHLVLSRRLAEASADIRSPEEMQRGSWNLDQFSPDKDLSMSEALSPDTTSVEPMSILPDKTKVRRPNTLYQECKFTEVDEKKEEDPLDSCTVSDNIFGMGKEVENIIMENIELLATKNALNIVKDDLIARVDLLSSEKEIREKQLKQVEVQRDNLKEKVEQLETEIKKMKEDMEKLQMEKENEDTAVPMAQRKRFTRVEMARVLMERNQYKEKLMELQDAVRWSETLKATKLTEGYPEKPSTGLFKFFSNLFASDKTKPTTYAATPSGSKDAPRLANKSNLQNLKLKDGISERKAKERRDQLKKVKAHVAKDDIGRVQAYGWSLPTACHSGPQPLQSVPVPVFCRPLDQSDPNPQLKVWCAAGVDLTGDGGNSVVPHTGSMVSSKSISDPPELSLSSLVWICSGVQNRFSQVSVIDANNPADVLQTFKVASSLLLCIASVPGAKDTDLCADDAYLSECITADKYDPDKTAPDNKASAEPSIPVAEIGLNQISQMTDKPSEPIAPSTEKIEKAEEADPKKVDKMSTTLPTMWMGAQNGYLYIHSSKADWSTCIHRVKLSDCVLSIVHYRGRVFCSLANGKLAVFHRDPQTKEIDIYRYREVWVAEPENNAIRCLAVIMDSKIWCGFRNSMAVVDPETLQIESKFSVHPRKESQVRQIAHVGEGVWITIRLDSTFRLYHAKTHAHLQDVDIEPMISRMIGTGKLGFSFVRITCVSITCNRLWIGTGNGVILSLPLFTGSSSVVTTQPKKQLSPSQSLAEVASTNTEGNTQDETTDEAKTPDGSEQTDGNQEQSKPDQECISETTPTATPTAEDKTPTGTPGVPLSLGSVANVITSGGLPVLPGSCVRVDDRTIPYCNVTQAQLSFHGHKDSVRFILGVPGTGGMISTTSPAANADGGSTPPARCMFVLSGGEGYVDLRIGDESNPGESLSEKSDLSHLIVWEVAL